MAISLIPMAYAAAEAGAAPAQGGEGFTSIFLLLGFVLISYFLLWRPQSKRAKEHRDLVSKLAPEDEIVTSGGLVGKITKIDGDFIGVKIGNNVDVIIQRQAITAVLPKGTMKSFEDVGLNNDK